MKVGKQIEAGQCQTLSLAMRDNVKSAGTRYGRNVLTGEVISTCPKALK